jgi:hypothetical protein
MFTPSVHGGRVSAQSTLARVVSFTMDTVCTIQLDP